MLPYKTEYDVYLVYERCLGCIFHFRRVEMHIQVTLEDDDLLTG